LKKEIKNIEASIRAQLQNKAKETNRPFSEVLQYYAMERFLYRFSRSEYADKFILKGSLMFTAWQIPERRTTLDIDLLGYYNNEVKIIEGIIADICSLEVVPDGLVFDSKTLHGQKIKEDMDYEGVRLKFLGFLEHSRIPMQVDIGFGDVVHTKCSSINYPVILDLPGPVLMGYPIESVVSEKFEAIVKLGSLNSRMKDFYDIWITMRRFNFNGLQLTEALKKTFKHRNTIVPPGKPLFAEEIYNEKSDRQTLWKAFLKKGDIKYAPEKLSAVADDIENFLIEPLNAINKNHKFDKIWIDAGPWK